LLATLSFLLIPFLKNNRATQADIGTAETIPIAPTKNLIISKDISN